MILHILSPFGIHTMTPMKYAWLALTLLVLLMQALAGYRASRHICGWLLAIYLGATISDPLRWTKWWNWEMSGVLAALALLATLQHVALTTYFNKALERRHAVVASLGVTLMLVGIAVSAAAESYPQWPKAVYFIRIYAHLSCFALLVGAIAYVVAFRTVQYPVAFHSAIVLAVWFAAETWAGLQKNRAVWFEDQITLDAVKAGCLAVWWWIYRAVDSPRPVPHRPDLSGQLSDRLG